MIGQTVGHYRILERLGGGGMGVGYRAEDTKPGRRVALRFLPPELTRDDEARTRFLREARAAAQLDHPSICTVCDVGKAEDDRLKRADGSRRLVWKTVVRGRADRLCVRVVGGTPDAGTTLCRMLRSTNSDRWIGEGIR